MASFELREGTAVAMTRDGLVYGTTSVNTTVNYEETLLTYTNLGLTNIGSIYEVQIGDCFRMVPFAKLSRSGLIPEANMDLSAIPF